MVVWHKKNFYWLFILIIIIGVVLFLRIIPCKKCNGTGKVRGFIWLKTCPQCKGSGKITIYKWLYGAL